MFTGASSDLHFARKIIARRLISNMIRPLTLGIRLFANMFADEQVFVQITNLYPPITQILVPILFIALGTFVALVQTLVFTLLSMIYISEVSHAPHEGVDGGEHSPATGEAVATAHV
ncbi:MAG: F0F1 ATP synthase subunit A [Acidobacteria bacterium]|nr:F0F1 ATP synthase subunit A [Acidobacteriota bacterium]